MTVSSLWKVLDTANSGQPIGVNEIASSHHSSNNTGDRQRRQTTTTTLAVDLSIWICESMTTFGINEQHANPTLHLVFTRTMKLLNLGLGLIFVIEGKQRIHQTPAAMLTHHDNPTDKFRKRRSGTVFWKACNDCQQMLELLGVPVVRAKSEGEALCALLSIRGIVDGVISNDGDCLLFGATSVYTKYSNENLDNGRIMRYQSNSLYALADPSDETLDSQHQRIKLSRHDLMAFAVLTGSDLTGKGLHKVGHKKAVRFIRKCQLDNPISTETAAFDEMKSWAVAAAAEVADGSEDAHQKCCTRCNHAGSKRSHAKDGCVQCGTNPGEACYHVTSEDRFRQALRAKALEMKFDAGNVFENYLRPNENQLPMQLVAHGVNMGTPNLSELMKMNLIVKGHSRQGSQAFVRQSVLRLLSRYELNRVNDSARDVLPPSVAGNVPIDRPVAKLINKSLIHNQVPSYEIKWVMNATLTDENGDGVDGYEYVTIEPKALVEQTYPQLLTVFEKTEIIRSKQGDGMKNWRQNFLHAFGICNSEQIDKQNHIIAAMEHVLPNKPPLYKLDKKRKGGFNIKVSVHKRHRRGNHKGEKLGEDIQNLLRFTTKKRLVQMSPLQKIREPSHRKWTPLKDDEYHNYAFNNAVKSQLIIASSDERVLLRNHHDQTASSSTFPTTLVDINDEVAVESPITLSTDIRGDDDDDDEIYCSMGGYSVAITPIASNQGAYPPKHIFIRHDNFAHFGGGC